MERINKAALFEKNTTRSVAEVWRFSAKPVGLGVAVLFLKYTFVFRERKKLLNYSTEK